MSQNRVDSCCCCPTTVSKIWFNQHCKVVTRVNRDHLHSIIHTCMQYITARWNMLNVERALWVVWIVLQCGGELSVLWPRRCNRESLPLASSLFCSLYQTWCRRDQTWLFWFPPCLPNEKFWKYVHQLKFVSSFMIGKFYHHLSMKFVNAL